MGNLSLVAQFPDRQPVSGIAEDKHQGNGVFPELTNTVEYDAIDQKKTARLKSRISWHSIAA